MYSIKIMETSSLSDNQYYDFLDIIDIDLDKKNKNLTVNDFLAGIGLVTDRYEIVINEKPFIGAEILIETVDDHKRIDINIRKKKAINSSSGNPLTNYKEQQRICNDLRKSTAEIVLISIGSFTESPVYAHQENPNFLAAINDQGKSVAVFCIDPLYTGTPYEKLDGSYYMGVYSAYLHPKLYQTRALLEIIGDELENNKKFIIYDNCSVVPTEFFFEIGFANQRFIHKSLELISGYGAAQNVHAICHKKFFDPACRKETYNAFVDDKAIKDSMVEIDTHNPNHQPKNNAYTLYSNHSDITPKELFQLSVMNQEFPYKHNFFKKQDEPANESGDINEITIPQASYQK